MALQSSSRLQDPFRFTVDPDKGIYVNTRGVIQIRTASKDVDLEDRPLDMMDFQDRTLAIPKDYCRKNRQTTEQKLFFCLVCNCDLMNK